MRYRKLRAIAPAIAGLVAAAIPLLAQQPRGVTAADYARAEKFLAANVTPLVTGGSVAANWLPDDRFWDRNVIAGGAEFILVDPVKKTRTRAFDHEKIAASLSSAAGGSFSALRFPFESIDLAAPGKVSFNLGTRRWTCDTQGATCSAVGDAIEPPAGRGTNGERGGRKDGRDGFGDPSSSNGKPMVMSPNRKRGVFIRDWNLWVFDA